MDDRYTIDTPENIEFDYDIAGIGSRFLAAIIDTLLIGIGVVVMFVDRRARRLGDLTAGTLVVKERRGVTLESLTAPSVAPLPQAPPGTPDRQPTLPNIQLLNDQDYTLIQEFLRRREELGREARARLGTQLASGLQARLGLPQGGDAERFLQFVAAEYQLLKRQQMQNL